MNPKNKTWKPSLKTIKQQAQKVTGKKRKKEPATNTATPKKRKTQQRQYNKPKMDNKRNLKNILL